MEMEAEPLDLEVDEGSDTGGEMPQPQISPRRSGAWLGFLVDVQPSPSRSRAALVAGIGSSQKRARTSVASSSDTDRPVQMKGKTSVGDKRAKKAKSPW
jgi:hypothetical protein